MKTFLLLSVLLSQLASADVVTSTITRDVAPDGRWSFTFAGTCNNMFCVERKDSA